MGKLSETTSLVLDCGSLVVSAVGGTLLTSSVAGAPIGALLYVKAGISAAQCFNSSMRTWNAFTEPGRNDELDKNGLYKTMTYSFDLLDLGFGGSAGLKKLLKGSQVARVAEVNRVMFKNGLLDKRIWTRIDDVAQIPQLPSKVSKKVKQLKTMGDNGAMSNKQYKAFIRAQFKTTSSTRKMGERELMDYINDNRDILFREADDVFDVLSGANSLSNDVLAETPRQVKRTIDGATQTHDLALKKLELFFIELEQYHGYPCKRVNMFPYR